MFDAQNLLHINIAQMCKLAEHRHTAFHIRARIDQNKGLLRRGHYAADHGAFYAFNALDNKGRAHKQSTRTARRNKGVAFAVGKRLQPHRHRGVFARFDNLGRLGFHLKHFVCL